MNPEEFKSAGAYPTGPVSLWPKERHDEIYRKMSGAPKGAKITVEKDLDTALSNAENVAMPTIGRMAKGLINSGAQALRRGRVSEEIRNERLETCAACPLFDPKSKRCRDCGCFMEAKSWIGGDPNNLCPQQKWER